MGYSTRTSNYVERIVLSNPTHMMSDEAFYAVVKTHKRRSKKIYKSELTKIKIENQVKCKYGVDPQRTRLTFIAEFTWSNLGLKEVLNN